MRAGLINSEVDCVNFGLAYRYSHSALETFVYSTASFNLFWGIRVCCAARK